MQAHPDPPAPADPDGLGASRSPLRLSTVRNPLGVVLDRLGDDARERALHEFVGLANRLLVADGGDTGDPAAHRAALETGAGGVTIALEGRGAVQPADLERTSSGPMWSFPQAPSRSCTET